MDRRREPIAAIEVTVEVEPSSGSADPGQGEVGGSVCAGRSVAGESSHPQKPSSVPSISGLRRVSPW